MGGRAKSPKTPPPATAVADSELFPFALDQIDVTLPVTAPKKKARGVGPGKNGDKPHYHDHRARLREKFDQSGPGALADYELLEMLLFRTIPRQDTKPLAKALLTKFGDLAGVLGAPVARIAEVSGAGPAVAQDLKLAHAVMSRAQRAEIMQRPVVSSWSALVNYCRTQMAHAPREQFRVLFLDIKNQLIADEVLAEGTIDHAPVYPREIARRALELSAAAVILVHNHPSGDPKPSTQDIHITREIVAAADAVSVKVHDHLIIGRDGASSFKSLGLL